MNNAELARLLREGVEHAKVMHDSDPQQDTFDYIQEASVAADELEARSAESPAVPHGYIRVTDDLLNFLCGVGHHGAVITDEGQEYEIGEEEIEYAQTLFTELRDAAAPQPGEE